MARTPLVSSFILVVLLMGLSQEGWSGEKWGSGLRKEVEAKFERMDDYIPGRGLDSLIQRLESIAIREPENQELHYFLGCAYGKRNVRDGNCVFGSSYYWTTLASNEFKKVIALNPRYSGNVCLVGPYSKLTGAWSGLALRYLIQGDQDSARFAFKQGRDAGGFRDGILDYNRNMLVSCEKDAILFTNGDGDTFPALYLQVMEGVRRDVTIVNLSLLNGSQYIAHMKGPLVYSFASPVPIGLSDTQIREIQPVIWRTRSLDLPVPREAQIRYGATGVNAAKNGRIRFSMPHTFQVDSILAIRNQDIMVRDIVFANKWKRPIAFAVTCAPDSRIGLDGYLWFNGLVWHMEPLRISRDNLGLHEESLSALLIGKPDEGTTGQESGYRLKTVTEPAFSYDDDAVPLVLSYRSAFIRLAIFYIEIKLDMQRGIAILDRMERFFPRKTVPLSWQLLHDLVRWYDRGGRHDRFEEYARELEPIAWNMIENGDLRMQDNDNPVKALLDIYEIRKDHRRLLDLLLLLQKEYPKDKNLSSRIDELRVQLGIHNPSGAKGGRK